MIFLTTNVSVLQVVTGEAVTSIEVQASYVDLSNVGTVIAPSYKNTTITTNTTSTVVGSPASSVQRAIHNLTVHNSDPVNPCDIKIQHTDGLQ